MAKMPTFDEIREDFDRGVRTAEQHIEHPFRHPQAPAQPEPAAHAAPNPAQEDHDMSAITVLEDGWNATETEFNKLKAALPGALAKAKQFEASPFAQLAEKVAGTVLPPEAVAIAVNAADKVIDDLIGLYSPATPIAPAEPVPAPAQ